MRSIVAACREGQLRYGPLALLCLCIALLACRKTDAPVPRPPQPAPATDVKSADRAASLDVAVGASHSCALQAAGTVVCWGTNSSGQLGDGTFVSRAAPVAVEGLVDVVALGAGQDHTCAVRSSGAVVCWGDNRYGQLGLPSFAPHPKPVAVPTVRDVVAVVGTERFTCVTLRDKSVKCWGDGSIEPHATDLTRVAAAHGRGGFYGDELCALDHQGTVHCASHSLESGQEVLSEVTSLSSDGGGTFCALRDDVVVCWDSRRRPDPSNPALTGVSKLVGSCGLKGERVECLMHGASSSAVQIATPGPVTDLFLVGSRTYCARGKTGSLSCWGGRPPGSVTEDLPNPRVETPYGLSHVVSVSAYSSEICGHLGDGTALCWGMGERPVASATAGAGAAVHQRCVVADNKGRVSCDGQMVAKLAGVRKVVEPNLSFSSGKTCALTRDGRVACWRVFDDGTSAPWYVAGVKGAQQLAVGKYHGCVRYADGRVECWYDPNPRRGGDGVPTSRNHFTTVTDAVELVGGGTRYCARLETGRVACWGDLLSLGSFCGKTASGHPGFDEAPVVVSGVKDAIAIAAGPFAACALETSGATRCWDGFLGLPSCRIQEGATARTMGTFDGATALAVGVSAVCVLQPGGRLTCAGAEEALGAAAPSGVAVPTRVSALANVKEFMASGHGYCAAHSDGTVDCTEEFTSVLVARFHPEPLLNGHHLQAAGPLACGWRGNRLTFLGDFGHKEVEFEHEIIDFVSREGASCVLTSDQSLWCTPAGVQFKFKQEILADPTARLGSLDDAVCAISNAGALECRTFADSTWVADQRHLKVADVWGNRAGSCSVQGTDTVCTDLLTGWGEVIGAAPAGAQTRLPGITIVDADFGADHRCVVDTSGTVACWGEGGSGQLGLGDYESRATPTRVPGLHGVVGVEIFGDSTCALTADGEVWCWGDVGDKSIVAVETLDAAWVRALQ